MGHIRVLFNSHEILQFDINRCVKFRFETKRDWILVDSGS